MPFSDLDRLLLEEEPEEERLSGLDQALLGVPEEEAPTEEPTWWERGWREYEEEVGLPAERPWHERLGAVAKSFTPWGVTGEDIERISVIPEWQGIQQKISSGSALTEDEMEFTDRYLEGHTIRPPGFTSEEWLAQSEAVRKGYNYLALGMIVAGVTAPIWTHPSFGAMAKQAALKLYRGKLPERIPVESGRMVIEKGKYVGEERVVTMRPPTTGISASSVAREFATIKPAITKTVKTLLFKDTLNKQLYDLVGKIKAEYKLPISVEEAVTPLIQTADAIVGSPITGLINPAYAEVSYNQLNKVLPFMINQLITSGKATPQIRKELSAEEEIVEREMEKPLEEFKTAEEYAPPEVAPKAEMPEEKIPIYMEEEINTGGGPVLGAGIELTDKELFTEPKEKNALGKGVDAITKWVSVYTKVKKEYPEAYQMFREFKGGQELAWINAKQNNEELWGKITQDEALAIQRYRQNPEKYPLEKLAENLRPIAGKVENAMETWKDEFIGMGKMKVGWPQSYIDLLDKEKEKLLGEIPLLKQQKAIERRQSRITEIDDLVGILKTRRFFPGRYLNTPEGQAALLKFLPEGRFRRSQIREKWIKGKTITDIDAALEAGLEPLDPRAAMLDYLYWAETEKNKWVLYQGLKADPNLVMLAKDAPEWWDEATGLSELKGYKINPVVTDVLREFEAPTRRVGIENAYRQVARTGKIASFYNPIIMGGIYDPQQGLAAAGLGALNPVTYARSIKSITAKDEFYKQCVGADLFPKPVDLGPQRNMDQLILSAVKQMDESTPDFTRLIESLTDGEWNFKGETNTKKMLKTIKGMYSAEWNLTWNLDAASRMTTVKALMAKGWPFEKAVERARFYHADYGDIPGNTRRFLNYFMWTPSYQIAMGKVYANLARHPVKERGPLARIIAFQLLVATGMAIAGYSWERGNRFVKKERKVEDVIVNPGPLYWLNKNIARNPIQSLYWQSSVPMHILWSIDRNSDGLGGTVYDKKADQTTQVAQIADFVIKRFFRPLEAAKRLNDTERSLLDRLVSLAAISKYQRKVRKKKKVKSKYWWR